MKLFMDHLPRLTKLDAQDRALQQGMVQSVVTVMRQTPEVDVLTLGVSSLSSDTWRYQRGVGWIGWMCHFCSVGWLFLTEKNFPQPRYYMVLVRGACLDQKPWLFVVLASCKQLLHRLDAEVSRQIIESQLNIQ